MLFASEERLGARAIRLLDEACDRLRLVAQVVSDLDVAVAGLGTRRNDPDGGDATLLGALRRALEDASKLGLVADEVIAREDHHQRLGIDPRDDGSGPRDARRSVAGGRLA